MKNYEQSFPTLCYTFLIAVVSLILLSGCDLDLSPNRELEKQYLQKSKTNLTTPEIIGQTETGQQVKRYHVYDPDGRDNYIYVVGNSVSNNSLKQSGKFQIPEVNTTILEDSQPSPEVKKEIVNIDFVYLMNACKQWEKEAKEGNESAQKLVDLIIRFEKLVKYVNGK